MAMREPSGCLVVGAIGLWQKHRSMCSSCGKLATRARGAWKAGRLATIAGVLLALSSASTSFLAGGSGQPGSLRARGPPRRRLPAAAKGEKPGDGGEVSLFDQAVWNAAEALGAARAALSPEEQRFDDGDGQPARSQEELVSRLRADYDKDYFLTGDLDVQLYAEDCEFSDPFAGFRGRDRFVANLRNLAGGFITAYRVKLLDFDATPGGSADSVVVRTRLRVVLELGLPWRPVLGWVWGVTHECEAGPGAGGAEASVWRCVAHREAWEIDPAEGVAMVFRPGKGRLD